MSSASLPAGRLRQGAPPKSFGVDIAVGAREFFPKILEINATHDLGGDFADFFKRRIGPRTLKSALSWALD